MCFLNPKGYKYILIYPKHDAQYVPEIRKYIQDLKRYKSLLNVMRNVYLRSGSIWPLIYTSISTLLSIN